VARPRGPFENFSRRIRGSGGANRGPDCDESSAGTGPKNTSPVTHTTPTHNCSVKGSVLTHTHRRFPVRDLELGITVGFINFAQGLPDVHNFKYCADGKIHLINAVFGGRQQVLIWPDETK
jgi:hypothetical protein